MKCWHCPFRFKENPYGADFDQEFTVENVEDWVDSNPYWPCHKHPEGDVPCSGQRLFKKGKLDVTKEELISFWVNRDWTDKTET